MTWYAFAAKKKPIVTSPDIVLLFLQKKASSWDQTGRADDKVYVGSFGEGGVRRILQSKKEIVLSGDVLVLDQAIEVDENTRALVTPFPSFSALRDSVLWAEQEDCDSPCLKEAIDLWAYASQYKISCNDLISASLALESIAKGHSSIKFVEVDGVTLFLGPYEDLKDLWYTFGFLGVLGTVYEKYANPGHTNVKDSSSSTKDTSMEQSPTSEEKVFEAVKTDPIQFALEHSFGISLLFGGDPLVVLRTKEASTKDYDRILSLPYKFFCAFETSLYVLPFVHGGTIEYSFFVHTSDIKEDPEFLTTAESWISGFLEGTEKI